MGPFIPADSHCHENRLRHPCAFFTEGHRLDDQDLTARRNDLKADPQTAWLSGISNRPAALES